MLVVCVFVELFGEVYGFICEGFVRFDKVDEFDFYFLCDVVVVFIECGCGVYDVCFC